MGEIKNINHVLVLDLPVAQHTVDDSFFRSVETTVGGLLKNPSSCPLIFQACKDLSTLSAQHLLANQSGFVLEVMRNAVTAHNDSTVAHSPGCQLFTSGVMSFLK